jgi:hypothetical protein
MMAPRRCKTSTEALTSSAGGGRSTRSSRLRQSWVFRNYPRTLNTRSILMEVL